MNGKDKEYSASQWFQTSGNKKKELLANIRTDKINYSKSASGHSSSFPRTAHGMCVDGPLTYVYNTYTHTYHCSRVYSSSRFLNIQDKSFWEVSLVKELLHTRGILPHSAGLHQWQDPLIVGSDWTGLTWRLQHIIWFNSICSEQEIHNFPLPFSKCTYPTFHK